MKSVSRKLVPMLLRGNPSAEDLHTFFSDWSDENLIFVLETFNDPEDDDSWMAEETLELQGRIVAIVEYEIDLRMNALSS